MMCIFVVMAPRAFGANLPMTAARSFARNLVAGVLRGPRLALPTQAAGFGSGFSASTAKLCRNIATQLRHDFDAAGVVVSGDELWTWMHNLPMGAAKEARA
jgi:hypothetical protein